MDDPCDGCIIYEKIKNGISSNTPCLALKYFKLHNLENDCPCIHCVIKMMCSETCDKRYNYGYGKDGYYE